MRNSKALKGFPYKKLRNRKEEENPVKEFFSKIFTSIQYFYWDVESFFHRYKERIGRSFDYARFGWLNYDFDSAYMFHLMEFKLKRILDCLLHGHAVQDKVNIDALKEAIKIVERLGSSHEYDDKYHEAHSKKWGRIKSKHIPIEFDKKGKPTLYRWETSRKNVKTPKQKEQERKEFMECVYAGERDRLADHDRLNEIFKKHERGWWD